MLSVNDSREQQAKENKNADSISLSNSFDIRGQQTNDSQWLSMDIRGRTVENNSFAAISALASEEIPTADSMLLSIEDDTVPDRLEDMKPSQHVSLFHFAHIRLFLLR